MLNFLLLKDLSNILGYTRGMDPLSIYKKISGENSVLLHSSRNNKKERYSIIAFGPFLVFESKGNMIKINNEIKFGNPFDELQKLLERYKTKKSKNTVLDGLVIGYFGYGAVRFIEKLSKRAKDDLKLPDMRFGFYKNYLVFDHLTKRIILVGNEKKINSRIKGIQDRKAMKNDKSKKPQSNFTKQEYINAVKKVQEYVKAGDTFQVNLSQRFEVETTKDPLEVYEELAKINPSHFGAFIDFGKIKLICSSPERLVKLNGNKVSTRPIAGTRPRGKTKNKDKKLEKELKDNEKELAEHLMLVDLERNDLGKVCDFGSVKVDELLKIEKYSHVMHLVSEVSGKLREDKTSVDLIKAMFPGGTITGCPKVRTMEIIDELEPTTRGPYTGALGYFTLSGDLDFNMIIRTIVMKGKKAYIQIGGGIVFDSVPKKEYVETMNKGKALFEALGV